MKKISAVCLLLKANDTSKVDVKNVLHLVLMNHFRSGVVSLLREDAVRGCEDTGRKKQRERKE